MEKSFRQILREELDYQGLTVKELSIKADVQKGALDSYLSKQASMPPADTAAKIADALGVTIEYLLNGCDNGRTEAISVFSSPKKRSLLRVFDELSPEDQKLTLDFAKLLKKNREESDIEA